MEKNSLITNKLISQCVDMISVENDLLKKKIIDPLVLYFKKKLWLFYFVITILLILILLTNIILIYKVFKFESLIPNISIPN